MEKQRVSEEELMALRSFGCKVNDYSWFDKKTGEYHFEVTVTYKGMLIGNETNSYQEIEKNLLRLKVEEFSRQY